MRFAVNKIIRGDVLGELKKFPDESIDMVISSPPYYGLRDYGTATWEGGNKDCDHLGKPKPTQKGFNERWSGRKPQKTDKQGELRQPFLDICGKCGAKRIDKQVGLENTFGEYLEKLLLITSELKRVLKKTGTLWWNHGDSYGGSGMGLSYAGQNKGRNSILSDNVLKAMPKVAHTKGKYGKSLLLQNFRLVQRMIDEQGWILRNEIIWHKPNCMPSSVKDRFTVDFEKIFFFTKSRKYYFNTQYEPVQACSIDRLYRAVSNKHKWIDGPDGQTQHTMNKPRPNRNKYKGGGDIGRKNNCAISTHRFDGGDYLVTPFNPKLGRNKRCVWKISTKPFRGAHFAVFPEELVETPIKAGCPNGGIVLDPFMGSGTTAVVAKKLGRNYVGIELNPKYIEIAEDRLKKVSPNNGRKNE